MDDILYIVLGVAWLAWSLYSNKLKSDKKRADQAQREVDAKKRMANPVDASQLEPVNYEPAGPAPAKPTRSILEEIFSEFVDVPEADQEYYEPEVDEKSWQKKREVYSKSEAQSLEEIREEIPADYFSKQYEQRKAPQQQLVINMTKDETEEDETLAGPDDFDLKKAVIYSEILRAPYVSWHA